MEIYEGKSILPGIAIGKMRVYARGEQRLPLRTGEDPEAELLRFQAAREQALCQLRNLYEKAWKEAGEAQAAIFDAQGMLLEDEAFRDFVRRGIQSSKLRAESAVEAAGDHFAKKMEQAENEYLRARAADIRDVAERVVRILLGRPEEEEAWEEPVILLARDLAPSETVQMDRTRILAFVTELGSANSHTAILARAMNIPALTGVPLKKELEGRLGIVDGERGLLIADPDPETLETYRKKKEKAKRRREELQALKDKEDVTLDGKRIRLYANIGSLEEAARALEAGAGGIGLFRSEFLYLGKRDYPTEEEQFQAYKAVAEIMAGRKVIIRTLDIGADKQADYFHLDREANPAMGYRAIRICLDRKELFRTQLRAIYRASAYGNIALMYPMIISVQEIRQARALAEQVQAELRQQGIPVGQAEQGIMIETPAAAVISDLLAEEADFFSIGTNDLTQYLHAADRINPAVVDYFTPASPAVLRSLRMVLDAAEQQGIPVSVCGESAADPDTALLYVQSGIRRLSLSPPALLEVKARLMDENVLMG